MKKRRRKVYSCENTLFNNDWKHRNSVQNGTTFLYTISSIFESNTVVCDCRIFARLLNSNNYKRLGFFLKIVTAIDTKANCLKASHSSFLISEMYKDKNSPKVSITQPSPWHEFRVLFIGIGNPCLPLYNSTIWLACRYTTVLFGRLGKNCWKNGTRPISLHLEKEKIGSNCRFQQFPIFMGDYI